MKITYRLLAALLCAVLLFTSLGCVADSPAEDFTTAPSVPILTVVQTYEQAKAALLQAENRILDFTYSQSREVGGQTYSESAEGTASFQALGSGDMAAIVTEKLTYGTVKAEHTLSYCDGTAYSTISNCTFSSSIGWEDFVDSQLPAVLLDATLYQDAAIQVTQDGTVITFSSATVPESWVSDSKAAQLTSATGTALLDSSGALVQTTYSASFTCGPASYTVEASVRVSTPESLDLSALHPDHSRDLPELAFLEAPTLLLRAVGDIFTAQDMSCSISETIFSQAIPLIRNRQSKAAIAGASDVLAATLENTVQITDYRNQTTTSSQKYAYSGGICTSSVNGEAPVAQPGVTAEVMRTSIEDTILAGLFATGYLAGAEMTENDDFYILKFTGNESYCADLSADIGKLLNMDLDGYATSYKTTEAAGYLCINKHTGLPTSMGISFARTHMFGEVPYALTYQLDQALTLSGVDAYYAASGQLQAEAKPSQSAKPLFYKVTGADGQVMWLLGTIHVGDDRTGFLPQALYDALNASDSLAVEFDILAFEEQVADDPALQTQLAGIYYYLDGSTVADHLDETLYAAAKELILISGNQSAAADQQKIFVWQSLLEDFYLAQGYVLSSQKGVDLRLLQLAKEQGKQIIDIESGMDQLTMLAGFSDAVQAYLLTEALSSGCLEYADAVLQLYELWCQGDEVTLSQNLFPDASALPEDVRQLYNTYNDTMITKRNDAMVNAAKDLLESGQTVFYAVGLAHVLGENGLVNGLREAGYTVELVEYP